MNEKPHIRSGRSQLASMTIEPSQLKFSIQTDKSIQCVFLSLHQHEDHQTNGGARQRGQESSAA